MTNRENQCKREHWVFLCGEQSLVCVLMTSEAPPLIPSRSQALCHQCPLTANVRSTAAASHTIKWKLSVFPLLQPLPRPSHAHWSRPHRLWRGVREQGGPGHTSLFSVSLSFSYSRTGRKEGRRGRKKRKGRNRVRKGKGSGDCGKKKPSDRGRVVLYE